MTFYARMSGGSLEELTGPFDVIIEDEVHRFPAGAAALMTDEERAARGIMAGVEAGPAPSDQRVIGQSLALVDGVPTRIWVTVPYPLTEARAIVWERVKTLRDEKADLPAPTPLGVVDNREQDRARIQGAVTMAMLAKAAGAPFVEHWTMADNTVVDHDADEMIAMGLAVAQRYSAVFARGRALRDAIAAAADPFQLDITSGWPA